MKTFTPAKFTLLSSFILGSLLINSTTTLSGPVPNNDWRDSPNGRACAKSGETKDWDWILYNDMKSCPQHDFLNACNEIIPSAYRQEARVEHYIFVCTPDAQGNLVWKVKCAFQRHSTDACSTESRLCVCDGNTLTDPSEYPIVINKGWSIWKIFTLAQPIDTLKECNGLIPSNDYIPPEVKSLANRQEIQDYEKKGYWADRALLIAKAKSITNEQKNVLLKEIAKKPIETPLPKQCGVTREPLPAKSAQ